MKSMNQVQHLLALPIPFSLVFSNSLLGADAFLVALASDCRRHDLAWSEAYSQRGLRENALTPQDLSTFHQLLADGRLQAISLGQDGTAYELVERPFRAYYRQAMARMQDDRSVLSTSAGGASI